MNTTQQNWMTAMAVALGLIMTAHPLGMAQAQEPVVQQESVEALWGGHLIANCPTNTSVTKVAWKLNGARIEFVATVPSTHRGMFGFLSFPRAAPSNWRNCVRRC